MPMLQMLHTKHLYWKIISKYCKGIKIEDLDGMHLCEFDTFIGPQKPQTDHILGKFQ